MECKFRFRHNERWIPVSESLYMLLGLWSKTMTPAVENDAPFTNDLLAWDHAQMECSIMTHRVRLCLEWPIINWVLLNSQCHKVRSWSQILSGTLQVKSKPVRGMPTCSPALGKTQVVQTPNVFFSSGFLWQVKGRNQIPSSIIVTWTHDVISHWKELLAKITEIFLM